MDVPRWRIGQAGSGPSNSPNRISASIPPRPSMQLRTPDSSGGQGKKRKASEMKFSYTISSDETNDAEARQKMRCLIALGTGSKLPFNTKPNNKDVAADIQPHALKANESAVSKKNSISDPWRILAHPDYPDYPSNTRPRDKVMASSKEQMLAEDGPQLYLGDKTNNRDSVLIKNLDGSVKKQELFQLITDNDLPLPSYFNYEFDVNGNFRDSALATFTTSEEENLFISVMDGYELCGKKLRVEYAWW